MSDSAGGRAGLRHYPKLPVWVVEDHQEVSGRRPGSGAESAETVTLRGPSRRRNLSIGGQRVWPPDSVKLPDSVAVGRTPKQLTRKNEN